MASAVARAAVADAVAPALTDDQIDQAIHRTRWLPRYPTAWPEDRVPSGGGAGKEDVEAAFEFGGAVVGGQGGGEAAEQGEFADRQPVQAQPQQVVGLVWVVDEFLSSLSTWPCRKPNRAR